MDLAKLSIRVGSLNNANCLKINHLCHKIQTKLQLIITTTLAIEDTIVLFQFSAH